MAIKFQYNKTSLQGLNKQLKMRLKALPIIKNKETALRMEVKKAKKKRLALDIELKEKIESHTVSFKIWNEFNSNLIAIQEVKASTQKIAGVKIPVLEKLVFKTDDFSLFASPTWFPEGVSIIKKLGKIAIESEFYKRKEKLLNHARRKTTQKVNLYEKVQIPGYEDAIRKIKRFLEDEENLSKAAQKIVKDRQQQQKEEDK